MDRSSVRTNSIEAGGVLAPRRIRNKALSCAVTAALAFGAAGAAAADSLYTLNTTQALGLQDYLQMVGSKQELTGSVTATATGGEIGFGGLIVGGALAVDGNAFQALTLAAGGLLGANAVDNSINLGLLGVQDDGLPLGDSNQGIGIFSGQFAHSAAVGASLGSDRIGLELTGSLLDAATVDDNTLASIALANGASNRATGDLNTIPFEGDVAGAVSVDYVPAGASVAAAGGVTIGNAQATAGVMTTAVVEGSSIGLAHTAGAESAPVDVSGNAATAAATGNRSDNRFGATAGAPAYDGSVGVVNGQVNTAGSIAASVATTEVGATLGSGFYEDALNVSGNRVSAAAQGNEAAALGADGGLVRGNAIVFGGGIDVDGNGAGARMALEIGDANDVSTEATADLALVNTQGNQSVTISGIVSQARVGAEVAGLIGGGVAAIDNHAAASAGGNNAINLVTADGARFHASVAAGSTQANNGMSVVASATSVSVGVSRGGSGLVGDIAVGDSSISATASGNGAQTIVDLQAASFDAAGATGKSGGLSTSSSFAVDPASTDQGVVAGNVQGNYGLATNIQAQASNAEVGATYAGAIASNISVDASTISATASGNTGNTSVSASGAEGALKAVLGNAQHNESAVMAAVAGAFAGAAGAGDTLVDSTVAVSGNGLQASATANRAGNALSAEFNGTLSFADSPAAGGNVISVTAGGNNAFSAAGLVNNQADTGSVSASLGNGMVGVLGSSSVVSSAAVQDNSVGASAIGNSVGNSLALDAGNFVQGSNGDLAALANLQAMGGSLNSDVSAVGVGYAFDGSAVDLAGTVEGNRVSAFAGGNMAGGDGGEGNRLAVSGTNLMGAGDAYVDANFDLDTSLAAALAGFTLQNAQVSTTGARTAMVSDTRIGGAAADGVVGGTQSVADNGISADARDNYAANALGLDFDGNLTTTGMLQNVQLSSTLVSGQVASAELGVTAANATDAIFSVAGNGIAAKAVANTASNRFAASASQLAGNAGDGFVMDVGAPAGYRGAAINAGEGMLAVVADYGLSNAQELLAGSSIQATLASAQVGISTDTGGFVVGAASVSGNTVTVLAQGNSAGSSLSLDASSSDATAAMSNYQAADSSAVALASSVHVNVNVDGSIVGNVPVAVSGNRVDVAAGLNDATNVVGVAAGNAIAGSVDPAGASDDAVQFDGFAGAVADYAVSNLQQGNGSAIATLSSVRAGVVAGSGVIGPAALTVSDNQFTASASGNNAGSSVALDAAGSIGATAAVANRQDNVGTVSSTVWDVDVAAGNRDTGIGSLVEESVAVSGNRVAGSASGNAATNAIAVESAVLNAPAMPTSAGSGAASSAIAASALNSAQGNQGTIDAQVGGVTIGTNLNGGMGAVSGGQLAIGDNLVAASGTGNSAGNSIALASAVGMPSAALASSQVNAAGVSATVNDVLIGAASNSFANSSATVSNNTISATAAANSAINQIGVR